MTFLKQHQRRVFGSWIWNKTGHRYARTLILCAPGKRDRCSRKWKCLFSLLRLSRHCSWVHSSGPDGYASLLYGSSEACEGRKYEGYDRECGQQERSTSVMTMHQLTPCFLFKSCWQSIWFLAFHNLRIRLTYLLRTFSIPASKNCPEMKISNGRVHYYECKSLTERYSAICLGSVLSKAEKAIGVMNCC
jgi:hypothetical protein